MINLKKKKNIPNNGGTSRDIWTAEAQHIDRLLLHCQVRPTGEIVSVGVDTV